MLYIFKQENGRSNSMGLNTKVIYVRYRNLLWDFYTRKL